MASAASARIEARSRTVRADPKEGGVATGWVRTMTMGAARCPVAERTGTFLGPGIAIILR
jgi:hypothetical protein